MILSASLRKLRQKLIRTGEARAAAFYRKEISSLKAIHEKNLNRLKKLHLQEIKSLQRHVQQQIKRLQSRESQVEIAMQYWEAKIEEADQYLLEAKNMLAARKIEKREIFHRMARAIAEETNELDSLLDDVNKHRKKVIESEDRFRPIGRVKP